MILFRQYVPGQVNAYNPPLYPGPYIQETANA